MPERYDLGPSRSQGLADILDRVLDKGLVIAGDIRVRLADVELLTIQIRLLVCSVDKAEQIGLNWWRADPFLTANPQGVPELPTLTDQLARIESRLAAIEQQKRQ